MSLASNISRHGTILGGVAKSTIRRKRRCSPQQTKFPVAAKSNPHPQKRRNADCKEEIDLIAAYLAGDLSIAARSEFAAHLKVCPDCAAFLATYKKTIAITRAFLQSHSPRELALKLSLHR